MALAYGKPDNATAIGQWQNDNALRVRVGELDRFGDLQADYNLTFSEIMGSENESVRNELSRRLSTDDVIEAMSKLKKWKVKRERKGVESILPQASLVVELDGGNDSDRKAKSYKVDILAKDDPRGFTIGEDTYCCMTIHGASSDCIKAGYTRPNCGFLAVYNNSDNMVAQSFWYIHPDYSDTIVMDNIEANDGQDFSKVAEIYKLGLIKYLSSHPELNIHKVNVGTGWTDIDLGGLPEVEPVPPLDYVSYTDAEKQRLLLEYRK